MKFVCSTSQLKYVFRSEENVSRVVGRGKNMNFRLARDQVVLLETTANL